MKLDRIISFLFAGIVLASCADLNYTEENTRDEEWTYEYFANGIKNMVFDVYAQLYNGEFDPNSAYFLAGATDEAQYALETGAVNNYTNGGWSAANPYSDIWTKSYTALADIHMYLEKIDQADISEWQYNPDYAKWAQQLEIFPYELRFLRAYFYFELFRAYGDVPLVTTTLTNMQANTIERTPVEQIVKFIVDELDAVAPEHVVVRGGRLRRRFRLGGLQGLAPLEGHADARQQLLDGERLGDIIVRAGIQAVHLVHHGVAGGEQDHRRLLFAAQAAQHLQPVQ